MTGVRMTLLVGLEYMSGSRMSNGGSFVGGDWWSCNMLCLKYLYEESFTRKI